MVLMTTAQVTTLVNQYAGGTDSDSIKKYIEYFMLDDTLFLYTKAYDKIDFQGDIIIFYKKNDITGRMIPVDIVDTTHIIVIHLFNRDFNVSGMDKDGNELYSDRTRINQAINENMLPME
jgi:hypothetical protein